MGMGKFFIFNNPVKGLEANERRFILPLRNSVSSSARVGHGAFRLDERRQILPVGGGSVFETRSIG